MCVDERAHFRLTRNDTLINKISKQILLISKEGWLVNNTNFYPFVLEVRKKKQDFYLDNNYADALFEFIKKVDIKEYTITEWQKSNWLNLVSLMNDSFKIDYSEKITEYLCSNIITVSIEFYTLNESLFNYKDIKKLNKIIQNSLDCFIKAEDFAKLELLNSILSENKEGKFIPDKYYSDVVSKPLNILYFVNEGDEQKQNILKELADKFHVKLIKEIISNDVEDLTIATDEEIS